MEALLPVSWHSCVMAVYYGEKSFEIEAIARADQDLNDELDATESEAYANNLIGVGHDSSVHLRSSDTPVVSTRLTLRLNSKNVYNKGLFIVDVKHSPQACGVLAGMFTV